MNLDFYYIAVKLKEKVNITALSSDYLNRPYNGVT